MFKNISFSQYKEIYLSQNQENNITNLKDNTKSSWGFYTNIEAIEPIQQLINRSLTANLDIDINEINDSMMDYNTDTDTDTNTNKYKYLLKIIPICVIVFFII
jgi:hypothetical protein